MSKLTEAAMQRGFIIANRGWSDGVKLEMGMSSFGRTAADAWRRHVGRERAASMDFPIYVQRWHDKGWSPHPVEVRLAPGTDDPFAAGRAALQAQEVDQ